ncbi:MAG: bifunctional phosphopantothenoylcysteine decarboxylase/phosphopantothenate--cysteine ligase CoaBC [Chlorobi bacterium]|nr:bifunctional phosphopantothenoylcysteine decarboxylase/phosphopantothenate--cysteine ligase CoaBC [Chlorobiota bacterium]
MIARILLGVTGSIAAYKSLLLLRLLQDKGFELNVILTPTATKFIQPLSFEALNRKKVFTNFLDDYLVGSDHVDLSSSHDLMVIAPATAKTISSLAIARPDNFLLATALAFPPHKVVVVPAMEDGFWKHPATQENINKLREYGYRIMEPGVGRLASGKVGSGRMPEPEEIVEFIIDVLTPKTTNPFTAIVTAGPTREFIDPVRFISNPSSGKTGVLIARELAFRGNKVILVAGPGVPIVKHRLIQRIDAVSAQEMFDAVRNQWHNADVFIGSAAVSDYTPVEKKRSKIKKKDDILLLELKKTPDILKWVGKNKRKGQIVVGFALETDLSPEEAYKKLIRKNVDLGVYNRISSGFNPFGASHNNIVMLTKEEFKTYENVSKEELARILADYIESLR